MKSTGVVRRIDELGRIVIPKEIRKNLRIKNGDNLEILVDGENIMLKKYSQIENLEKGIQEIEEIQKSLNKKVPFEVKFDRNYLWEIYYSESTSKYFMLIPTKEPVNPTLFYLIKKKIQNKFQSLVKKLTAHLLLWQR